MKKILTIILCSALVMISGCDKYDFDQEQFRKEVNLLSNSNLVYDRQVAELQQGGDTLFVVASLSGSQATDEPVTVVLQHSDTLLRAYNKSNFDINKARFAKYLLEECYEFPTMEMNISAGSSRRRQLTTITPVVRSLSRIRMGYSEVRRPTNSNRVFPISENSVRLMAGDENFTDYTTALDIINKGSIILEMGAQLPENPLAKELTILPYQSIDVVQLTPIGEYDNTYLLNVIRTPDGRSTYYKEFRLHYKYRLKSTDLYREVNAKLRYQFNPRVENL